LSSLGAKIGRIIENCKNLTIFLYLSQMALMTQILTKTSKRKNIGFSSLKNSAEIEPSQMVRGIFGVA